MRHACKIKESITLFSRKPCSPRSLTHSFSSPQSSPRAVQSTNAFRTKMSQTPVSQSSNETEKVPLRILMLHGFTQSGDALRAKTRALEKHMQKTLPLHDIQLVYPTAPLALKPEDIPGFKSSSPDDTERQDTNNDGPQDLDGFAWWRRSNTADPPVYLGLDTGLEAVARVLEEQGPFDGVMGFSQGAACAAIVASLLEPGRREAFEYFSDPANANTYRTTNSAATKIPSESAGATPIAGIPFPAPFANISHPPLRFAVCYSGFRAPGPRYRGFYERPQITTPLMHVVGSLDSIVDEARSRTLMAACDGDPEADGRVLVHPGGHFIPSAKWALQGVTQFVHRSLANNENSKQAKQAEKQPSGPRDTGYKSDVAVEDMDLPF